MCAHGDGRGLECELTCHAFLIITHNTLYIYVWNQTICTVQSTSCVVTYETRSGIRLVSHTPLARTSPSESRTNHANALNTCVFCVCSGCACVCLPHYSFPTPMAALWRAKTSCTQHCAHANIAREAVDMRGLQAYNFIRLKTLPKSFPPSRRRCRRGITHAFNHIHSLCARA